MACGAAVNARWAAQLFGPGHRDGPDAAAGISLAVAPDRGADGIHLRTAGGGAERARPQHLEPPGDEAHVNFQGLSPARWAGPFADRQHGAESLRRRRMAAGKAWRESAAHLEKAASCGGRRHRNRHGLDPDRQRCGDPSQVAPLLDQIDAKIASVTADGAYDG